MGGRYGGFHILFSTASGLQEYSLTPIGICFGFYTIQEYFFQVYLPYRIPPHYFSNSQPVGIIFSKDLIASLFQVVYNYLL